MFDKICDNMNNWRWGNSGGFGDQGHHSYLQTTSSGKVQLTGECFSWYCRDDLSAKIEPPNCQQYKPGDFLAVRSLYWDEIFNEEDDDESWADPGTPSGGRIRRSDDNDNHDGQGEEDKQGGEKESGKGKGTTERKGKGKGKATEEGKGKGKANGEGKGIVKHYPGGDDISCAIALQLQKEMYEADSDMEG